MYSGSFQYFNAVNNAVTKHTRNCKMAWFPSYLHLCTILINKDFGKMVSNSTKCCCPLQKRASIHCTTADLISRVNSKRSISYKLFGWIVTQVRECFWTNLLYVGHFQTISFHSTISAKNIQMVCFKFLGTANIINYLMYMCKTVPHKK